MFSVETTIDGRKVLVPEVKIIALMGDVHTVALWSIQGLSAVMDRAGKCLGYINNRDARKAR